MDEVCKWVKGFDDDGLCIGVFGLVVVGGDILFVLIESIWYMEFFMLVLVILILVFVYCLLLLVGLLLIMIGVLLGVVFVVLVLFI